MRILLRVSTVARAAVCGLALMGAAKAEDAVSVPSNTDGDQPTVNAGVSAPIPVGQDPVANQPSSSSLATDPSASGTLPGASVPQTAAEGAPTVDAPASATAAGAPAGEPQQAAETLPAVAAPVPSAYMTGMVRVPQAEMDAWLADPISLISTYPEAGIPMANYVRLLAASDNRAVPPLISLAGDTRTAPPQVASIGAGLARAAQGGQVSAPEYAAYIQQQVAASNNQPLITAFTAALAEQAVAALGPGGGPGGGGGGSGTVGGGGQGGTVNGNPNEPIPQSFGSSSSGRRSVSIIEDDDDDDDNDASPAR